MNDTDGFNSFWRSLRDCHNSRSSNKAPYITRTNEHFNQSCLDLCLDLCLDPENQTDAIRKGMDLNYSYLSSKNKPVAFLVEFLKMSDFTQFSLGETLKMKEVKNWKPSAPLTLYNKWIGVNNRYISKVGDQQPYITRYCAQNANLCKDLPNEITTKEHIEKYLRKLLTRFALLNRSGINQKI